MKNFTIIKRTKRAKRKRTKMGRRSSFKQRSKLTIRTKIRPKKQTNFNFEIKVRSVIDIPQMIKYGNNHITTVERDLYQDMFEMLNTLRTIIGGGYKIIQHRKLSCIETKVLLKSESDLYILTMAHPTIIGRVYRYTESD
jgi:hypothetical protein